MAARLGEKKVFVDGEKIKSYMKRCRLSYIDIAKSSGISYWAITNLCNKCGGNRDALKAIVCAIRASGLDVIENDFIVKPVELNEAKVTLPVEKRTDNTICGNGQKFFDYPTFEYPAWVKDTKFQNEVCELNKRFERQNELLSEILQLLHKWSAGFADNAKTTRTISDKLSMIKEQTHDDHQAQLRVWKD